MAMRAGAVEFVDGSRRTTREEILPMVTVPKLVFRGMNRGAIRALEKAILRVKAMDARLAARAQKYGVEVIDFGSLDIVSTECDTLLSRCAFKLAETA